jgi:glycosyltransferase involved in cell wall biosynthesis
MTPPILQVITATHRRGAEVYACDLRTELARLGLPMELVALRPGQGSSLLDVEVLATSRAGSITRLRARARGCRGLVAHGSDTLLAGTLATLGRPVPIVYRSIGDPAVWSGRRDRRLRVGAQLRRVAAVVCTFEGARTTLVRSYGVAPERVTVIPNGRPLDRFPPPTRAARAEARDHIVDALTRVNGIDGRLGTGHRFDGPLVLFVGALAPEKDPRAAVAAVAQLPDAHLLLLGDGPEEGVVRAYASAVAPGRVHLHPPLADPRRAYLAADALLLPSRTEGFPGVAIEAALCAIPVVATDVGAASEIVLDGVTGRVVAPGDIPALAEALTDVLGRREVLGTAGRDHAVAHFDLVTIAPRWRDLLDAVLP